MSSDYDPVTKLDPNAWYFLSESRVDNYTTPEFTSNFHIRGDGDLEVSGMQDRQKWQFLPVDEDEHPGRYYMRHNFFGPYKQLSVCQVSGEKSRGNTWPCLMESSPKEEQMWNVQDWGDDFLRFVNVKNGSDYWLDVHKGNPPYMRSDADEDNDNLGDKWLYTSVGRVNDDAYSTVFDAARVREESPQTTGGTASSSAPSASGDGSNDDNNSSSDNNDSGSSGLSAGATAGIGAGVGLAVIFLGVLIFWLLRRRKRGTNGHAELPSGSPMAGHADKAMYAGSTGHSQNTPVNPQGWGHSSQASPPPQGQQQTSYYPPQGGAYSQVQTPYQAGQPERPHELGGEAPAEMATDRY